MLWFSKLIFFTILFVANISEAKVLKQVLSKKQSVVTIYIESNKKIIAFGSGFIIDANGLVVTNHHVIAPWEKSKEGKLFVKKSDGKFLTPIEIVASDVDKDVAIIKVQETGLPVIKLATKYKPAQGESVVVIGSPHGFETTVTDGIVSGIRGEDGFVQITAPIAKGSSGSPVLNSNGEAIGVATLLMKDAQNLNFAIPVSYIESILSKPGISSKNDLTPTPQISATTVEEDLLVKMPYLPSKSIRWGMSIKELEKLASPVKCKENKSGVICMYVSPDFIEFGFQFKNYKLSNVSSWVPLPKLNTDRLDKELAEIHQTTGIDPKKHVNEEGIYYRAMLEHSECTASIEKESEFSDELYTFCSPRLYLTTYALDPAREPFKLLDITLGKSTQEDIIAISKNNGWQYNINNKNNNVIIYISGLKLDGVSVVEINLFDNKIESIKYNIDSKYSNKESYFSLLKSKYGQNIKDEKSYYVWEINQNTKDAVSIVTAFDGKPENVKSISYTLQWLSQKEIESKIFELMDDAQKSKELKSKAF